MTLELIKAGLGKVADWNLALLPRETVISLRAAEIEAKSNRRGVWYAFTPPVPSPGSSVCNVLAKILFRVPCL